MGRSLNGAMNRLFILALEMFKTMMLEMLYWNFQNALSAGKWPLNYPAITKARKKSSHTVVFFLTVKDLEEDILDGYNMGADDYITKPFSLQILMKKIEAVSNRMNALTHERQIYSDSHLYIDFDSFVAHAGNDLLEFTPLEFKFLKLLVKMRDTL